MYRNNPYEILGVKNDATKSEIDEAKDRLLQICVFNEGEIKRIEDAPQEIFYFRKLYDALYKKYSSVEYSRIPLFINGNTFEMKHYIEEFVEPEIPTFSPDETKGVHVIHAESGSGKTLLAQFSLFHWTQKKEIFANAELIFYISSAEIIKKNRINSLKESEMNNLNKYIYSQLGLAEDENLDKIIEKYHRGIVFILDGYDELLTHNLHALNLIQQLIAKHNVYVFTRFHGITLLTNMIQNLRPLNRNSIKLHELLSLNNKDKRSKYINVLFQDPSSTEDKQSNSHLFFSWLFNARSQLEGALLFGDIVTKPLSLQFLAGAWKDTFQNQLLPNKYQLLRHYVGYATNRFLIKRGLQSMFGRDFVPTLIEDIRFLIDFMIDISGQGLLINNDGVVANNFNNQIKRHCEKYYCEEKEFEKNCITQNNIDGNTNEFCQATQIYKEKIMEGSLGTISHTQVRLDLLDLNLMIDKTGSGQDNGATIYSFSNQALRDFFHYYSLTNDFLLAMSQEDNQFSNFFQDYSDHFINRKVNLQNANLLELSNKISAICALISDEHSDRLPDIIEKFFPSMIINEFTVLPAISCLDSILSGLGSFSYSTEKLVSIFRTNTINYFTPFVWPLKNIQLQDHMNNFLLHHYVFSHELARELGTFDALSIESDQSEYIFDFIQSAGLYDPTLRKNLVNLFLKTSNDSLLMKITDFIIDHLKTINDHPTKDELHTLIQQIITSSSTLSQQKSISTKKLLLTFEYLDKDFENYLIDTLQSSNFTNAKQILSDLITQLDNSANQMIIKALIAEGSPRAIETLIQGDCLEIPDCENSLVKFLANTSDGDITQNELNLINVFLKSEVHSKATKSLGQDLTKLQEYFNTLLDHTNLEVAFTASKFFLFAQLSPTLNIFKPLNQFLSLEEKLFSPPYHLNELNRDCSCHFPGQQLPDKRITIVLDFLLFLIENKKFHSWSNSNLGKILRKRQSKLIISVLFYYDCRNNFKYLNNIMFNRDNFDLLNILFLGDILFPRKNWNNNHLNLARSIYYFRLKNTLRCYAKSTPSIDTHQAQRFINLYPDILQKLDHMPKFSTNLQFIEQIAGLYTYYFGLKIFLADEPHSIIYFISYLFSYNSSPYKKHALLNLLLLSSSHNPNKMPGLLEKTSEIMYNFRQEDTPFFLSKLNQVIGHSHSVELKSVLKSEIYNYGMFSSGWDERVNKVRASLSNYKTVSLLYDLSIVDISPDEILSTSGAMKSRTNLPHFFRFMTDFVNVLLYCHRSLNVPWLLNRISTDWKRYRSSFYKEPVFPIHHYQRIPFTNEPPCYYRKGYTNFLEYAVDELGRPFYAKPGSLDPSERAIDLPIPRCRQTLDEKMRYPTNAETIMSNISFSFMLGFLHGMTLAGTTALTKALTKSERIANKIECAVSYAFLLGSLMANDTNCFNLLAPLILSIIVKNGFKWRGYSAGFSETAGSAASLGLFLVQSNHSILIWLSSQIGNKIGYSIVNLNSKGLISENTHPSKSSKKLSGASLFETRSKNIEAKDPTIKPHGCLERVMNRMAYMKNYIFCPTNRSESQDFQQETKPTTNILMEGYSHARR